jgi:hypothetical protein
MRPNHEQESIKTTLGDLIVAVSDAAFECCEDKRGAYLLAGLALNEIIERAQYRMTDMAEASTECFPDKEIFH